jgi:hypothetical protein
MPFKSAHGTGGECYVFPTYQEVEVEEDPLHAHQMAHHTQTAQENTSPQDFCTLDCVHQATHRQAKEPISSTCARTTQARNANPDLRSVRKVSKCLWWHADKGCERV